MFGKLKAFIADDSGATALEYGLIVALISILILAAVGAIGGSLEEVWTSVSSQAAAS